MKNKIILLTVSIIGIITFVCFSYNKAENKNVSKETESSTKETKIVSINKKHYSCNVPYISHDDYYDLKEKVKITNVVNNDEIYDTSDESVDDIIQIDEKENIVVEETDNKEVLIDNELSKIEELVDIKQDDEENVEDSSVEEENSSEIEKENDDEKIDVPETITEENDNNIELLLSRTTMNDVEDYNEAKSGYYSPSGKYLGESNVKVVDVSYYQGDINWDLFAGESDCYGVILRLGYYDTLDKKFEQNISELKRLNIPYGIYLFSYATTMNGSNKEADFTNQMIDKYDLKPTLGIYYDIESWNTKNGATSDCITKDMYDNIIINYINKVSNHINNEYKVKVYSGRWYAMNRLGDISKSYVDWVAEYNSTCKYDGTYSMWQYTSKGSISGINGNVDISYLY